MANTFTGTFTTPAKEAEFMAITTSVAERQFWDEHGLTMISLPQLITLGKNSFRYNKLTTISLPKVTTIGDGALFSSIATSLDFPKATYVGASTFHNTPIEFLNVPLLTTAGFHAFPKIVNAPTTIVTIPLKFQTVVEKDNIFGKGNWDKITFKEPSKPWKTKPGSNNKYRGTFSTPAKEAEFFAVTDTVADNQFKTESNITDLYIPNVTSIGDRSFAFPHLKTLFAPKVNIIKSNALAQAVLTSGNFKELKIIEELGLYHSLFTSLDLPKVISIGKLSFGSSPITHLNIPSATTIGDISFRTIVNAPTTTVIMQTKFNTPTEKDRIFGAGHWDKITFKSGGVDLTQVGIYLNKKETKFMYFGSKEVHYVDMAGKRYTYLSQLDAQKSAIDKAIAALGDNILNGLSSATIPSSKITKQQIINKIRPLLGVNINKSLLDENHIKLIPKGSFLIVNILNTKKSGLSKIFKITGFSMNSFTGTFSSPAKEAEFMATIDTVSDNQFANEPGLTGITMSKVKNIGSKAFHDSNKLASIDLPLVESIGMSAFSYAPLSYINVPFATKIDAYAFYETLNSHATKVIIQSKYNNNMSKETIFKAKNWDRIHFIWTKKTLEEFYNGMLSSLNDNMFNSLINNSKSSISITNKQIKDLIKTYLPSNFDLKFLKDNMIKITPLGTKLNIKIYSIDLNKIEKSWDLNGFKSGNSFTGTFSSPAKEAEFMAITTDVSDRQFQHESGLTGVSLPQVTNIGDFAFADSQLKHLYIPEAVDIGERAFDESKLTDLNIPKATSIGDLAFELIINEPTTTVTIKSKFNSYDELHRIFWKHWSKVKFAWS